MPRIKRVDFYEELERIERELRPLMEEEQAYFQWMYNIPLGEQRTQALAQYQQAVERADEARRRRTEFLNRYAPSGSKRSS